MHAETIAVDFDLDYSNQLKGYETRRFNVNGKIAPTGFIGTGIFSAPFLFIGHTIDKLVSGENSLSTDIFNYRLIFYSSCFKLEFNKGLEQGFNNKPKTIKISI